MRPPGSPADLEQRRRSAIELLEWDVPVHVAAARADHPGPGAPRQDQHSRPSGSSLPEPTSLSCPRAGRVGVGSREPAQAPARPGLAGPHPAWHVVWFPPYASELNPAEQL
jgi:hypothetical protein